MQVTTLTRSLAMALAVVFLAQGTPADAKSNDKVRKNPGSNAGSKGSKKGSSKSGSGAETLVHAPFLNTGVQPLANGAISFEGKAFQSELEIRLEQLDAGLPYSLLFNGMEWAAFSANSLGAAELRFESNPASPDIPMLPGDPRGGTLVVSDGNDDILTAVVSGPGEPPGSEIRERSPLDLGALPAKAKAQTDFSVSSQGQAHYGIQAEKLPAGSYMVLVDGAIKAVPVVSKNGGKFALEFSSPQDPSDLPLDFDPRSSVLEIHGPTGIAASGSGSPSIEDLNACVESETEAPLEAVAGVGKSHSALKVDDDCDRDFEVEVEDVPAGPYDVYAGGVLRGTLQAVFDPAKGEVEGELEWETDSDDPDELPLDFDPRGQTIEVFDGGTLIFERAFPS